MSGINAAWKGLEEAEKEKEEFLRSELRRCVEGGLHPVSALTPHLYMYAPLLREPVCTV